MQYCFVEQESQALEGGAEESGQGIAEQGSVEMVGSLQDRAEQRRVDLGESDEGK